MAADGTILQGEVAENPGAEEKDVEKLLMSLIQALLAEQSDAPEARR